MFKKIKSKFHRKTNKDLANKTTMLENIILVGVIALFVGFLCFEYWTFDLL